MYHGFMANAIFITDVSKKVFADLSLKKRKEQEERAKQAEGYTQMISNEMTTPLSTIIFFLNFIGSYLRSVDDQSDILSKKETK